MTRFYQIVVYGGPSSFPADKLYNFTGKPVCDPKNALDELMGYTDQYCKRAWCGEFSDFLPNIFEAASLVEGFLCHIADANDTTKVQVYVWDLYPKHRHKCF